MPPANTKSLRWKKIRPVPRVVYVSFLDPSPAARAWIEAFWDRLKMELGFMEDEFGEPIRTVAAQTEDAEPGGVIAQRPDPLAGESPVTDFIGVLTIKYLLANQDRKGNLSNGELARFFDRLIEKDREHILVFLAPVDSPLWEHYRIRGVRLHEPPGWILRLKLTRFLWPSEDPAKSGDEIAEAVRLITGTRRNLEEEGV